MEQVETTELIRTSQSWDGADLPDYFKGRPEIVAMNYVIPQGQKLAWHHHDAMNCGILVQGELTIVSLDGKTKVVHEGEAVVELVGTVHHGENNGNKTVILYMFFLSKVGLPLCVHLTAVYCLVISCQIIPYNSSDSDAFYGFLRKQTI